MTQLNKQEEKWQGRAMKEARGNLTSTNMKKHTKHHIIEQQKERAGKKAVWASGLTNTKAVTLKEAESLITQTHQATIAEVVRIAEGMKRLEMNDDYDGGYNHACDDLIEAITSNKE